MPYIAVERSSRASRLVAAGSRWDAVLAVRPDLAPAVVLQRRLLDLVMDAADTVGRGQLPKLSLPSRYLAAKLARGVPLLAGEPIPVPADALTPTLLRLCEALAHGGAGEAAEHIRTLVADGHLDAGSLLSASLARSQQAIRSGAEQRGLAPDLLWLVGELAVSPFVHALQEALVGAADPLLRAQLAVWNQGYCLVCGSWPALAEVVAGHRALRCSFCALAWELTRYACVYCGEDGERFVTAAPDEDRKDRRVEVCHACGGYLKTVDVAALSPFPLLAIADLETMDLDVAAMEHGFSRPPMKEFALRR